MISKATVKYIQSLSHKNKRDEERLFIVEGDKMVSELLAENPGVVVELFATKSWIESHPEFKTQANIQIADQEIIDKFSQWVTPQQVIALVQQFEIQQPQIASGETAVMLDTIQNPGNLGSIIRIADWFGVKHIICSIGCADLYNAKVVQATMGSIFRVNVFYTDLVKFISNHPQLNYFAATLDGADVRKNRPTNGGVIIIGNESQGISSDILAVVKNKISIPGWGRAESLNAAVAAGIILSHVVE